jgi:hypothetical protein
MEQIDFIHGIITLTILVFAAGMAGAVLTWISGVDERDDNDE